MTPSHRARVVELLRCAADVRGIGDARQALGLPWLGRAHCHALEAIQSVGDNRRRSWRYLCLEAARRAEEKSWP